MREQKNRILNGLAKFLTIGGLAALLAIPAMAQKAKEGKDYLDDLSFSRPELWLTSQGESASRVRQDMPASLVSAFDRFQAASPIPWTMNFDRVTGKPISIEGGLPWIPGPGMNNTLKAADLGVTEEQAAGNAIPVAAVHTKAMELLKTYPDLFGVNPEDLQLQEGASGPMLEYLYNLNYQWMYHGIPVEHAHLGFYLNSGNLALFGSDYICDTIQKLDPNPSFPLDAAWEILWGYLGAPTQSDEVHNPGSLIVQPTTVPEVANGLAYAAGKGLQYRLLYVLSFQRKGVGGTWEARIDAHTGEIISFKDSDAYGKIQGGVYKTDKNPTQTEVVMPFPYADYGATSFADAAGNFPGTTGTGTMTGRTGSPGIVGAVDITDYACGAISKVADGTGLINFGTSLGTDCTIPATGGGVGNTHASRTQYWNVAQIKIKAYTYLPSNSWLQGLTNVTVNYNLANCNAVWTGGATGYARFYSSGGGAGIPGSCLASPCTN